jgi:hypothetical protein
MRRLTSSNTESSSALLNSSRFAHANRLNSLSDAGRTTLPWSS